MSVKIYLTENSDIYFGYSETEYQEIEAKDLSITNAGGRVAFLLSCDGSMFKNYALSDIVDKNGNAYASFDAFMSSVTVQTSQTANTIDAKNTFCKTFAPNEVWTGEWVNTVPFGTIVVGIHATTASAVNGLAVEYSADGVTKIQQDDFSISANNGKTFSFGMANAYYRVSYTNGALASNVCLQSILKNSPIKESTHRISQPIVGDDDAPLVKSVLTGERDDRVFGNAKLDNEDRLQVSSQPYLFGIAEGAIAGHKSLIRCGTRTSISANNLSTIWEGNTDTYVYLTSAEQLKVSSDSTLDTSNGTGARTILIKGLDANWNEIEETITMAGLTVVTTVHSYIRVFDAITETCGTLITNAGNISVKNNANAVTLRIIKAGDGRSMAAMWTVPLGKVAYLTKVSASTDTTKGARFSFLSRRLNGGTIYPWHVEYIAYIVGGNNIVSFDIPVRFTEKTDIGVRFITPSGAGTTSGGATFELWYEDAD